MSRLSIRSAAAAAIVAAAAVSAPVRASNAALSLKISNETAPPGALVQMKLFVTEPKPISTATVEFGIASFSDIAGVALGAAARDALGVATVRSSRLKMAILSPGLDIASDPDYPVLTIVGRLPATAPVGARFAFSVDPASLAFTDGSGAVYPASVRDGAITVANHIGIEDVVPGSGDVAAGDRVTVVGRGFSAVTKIKMKEALFSAVNIVDSSHAVVTFALPATLQGGGFQAVNPNNDEVKYFSYQRTARQGTSAAPALQDAVPVFPNIEVTGATMAAGSGVTGLALQNRHATSIVADCVLVNAAGAAVAAASVEVKPRRFVLRELSELFGAAYSASYSVQISARSPMQVMGVAVDAAGATTPIRAR